MSIWAEYELWCCHAWLAQMIPLNMYDIAGRKTSKFKGLAMLVRCFNSINKILLLMSFGIQECTFRDWEKWWWENPNAMPTLSCIGCNSRRLIDRVALLMPSHDWYCCFITTRCHRDKHDTLSSWINRYFILCSENNENKLYYILSVTMPNLLTSDW